MNEQFKMARENTETFKTVFDREVHLLFLF